MTNIASLHTDNLSLMQKEVDMCWLLLGKMRIHYDTKTVSGSVTKQDEVKFLFWLLTRAFQLLFYLQRFNTTFRKTYYTDRLLCDHMWINAFSVCVRYLLLVKFSLDLMWVTGFIDDGSWEFSLDVSQPGAQTAHVLI